MATTPRWGGVTVDALDPEALAEFWAALFGTPVAGRWQQYVSVRPAGQEPMLAFQRVPARTRGKNALHLDLHVNDVDELAALVDRATALGAAVVETMRQEGQEWTVLEDPEGNRFCVVAAGSLGPA